MSQTGANPGPNDPPPQQDPTHDVPVYPEKDPPPDREADVRADHGRYDRHDEHHGHGGGDTPPGESEEDDVDEDDLDPQKPHSPPDAGYGVGKRGVIFDESRMPG